MNVKDNFLLNKKTNLTYHQLYTDRRIKEVVLHCSATAEGKDFTVDTIRNWHLDRGFNDIGYHFIIYRDGTINVGRDINRVGAHCVGHNTGSIGVCYIGGCAKDGRTPKDTRTPEQKIAMYQLINDILLLYPTASISGHYQWCNKSCPCFKIKTFMEEYKLYQTNEKVHKS